MAYVLWGAARRARLVKIFNKGPPWLGAVAAEAVAQAGFIDADYTHRIMLCTEMVELTGGNAADGSVDPSVLAAAPVPEGSLIPISEIAASVAQAGGDADGRNTPRVALRVICRDPKILDVTRVAFVVDPTTQRERVLVWVFRVTDPDGVTRDYRFRARLRSVASYEEGPGRVYNVFLYSYDAHPTVTDPEANPVPSVN